MVKSAAAILLFVFTAFISEQFVMPLHCTQQAAVEHTTACHKAGSKGKMCCLNKEAGKQKKNNSKACSDCPLSVQVLPQKISAIQPDVSILSTQYRIMIVSQLSDFAYRQIKPPNC